MPVVIFCSVEGSWVFCILGVCVVFSSLHIYMCGYLHAYDATRSVYSLYFFLWCQE
jgi:hypothetical protein